MRKDVPRRCLVPVLRSGRPPWGLCGGGEELSGRGGRGRGPGIGILSPSPLALSPRQKCLELKTSLLARQRGTQSSLDRLRALLRLIRGEPLLQVTVATTGPAPLLALPWTKPPAAAARPALQQPQGHN